MRLHGSTTSPFVRMCQVTAYECGIEDRVELVRQKVTLLEVNPEIAKLSGLGRIPVLVTDHGSALYDSRVIMEYLVHFSGNETLLPNDPVHRFAVLTLEALAMGLADTAVAYRYEQALRPETLLWNDWMARTEQRFVSIFTDAEQRWQGYLGPDDVTVGSIALACALSYVDFRNADLNWRALAPNTAIFYERFAQRRSMVETEMGRA